jgi:DNA-binding MarR family transcriptional regulator
MSEVSDIPEADWAVWRSFVVMRRQLDRALEHQLQEDAGISVPDFEILLSLFKAPGNQLRGKELVELLAWEKSRVSHQVTRMASRGLVERRECPTDLRGSWITLLPEGRRAVLKASRGNALELRRLFFDVLSDDEKVTLGAISDRIIERISPSSCTRAEEILSGESERLAAS